MKKLFLILSLTVCVSYGYTQQTIKQVSVRQFGAIPGDGQNDAEQLRKALDYCRSHPGTTLYFPGGIYDFRDEKAVRLMEDAMQGKLTRNPQLTIFKPYYPYVKGLDFGGTNNITVEAAGATLLCDGWMEPVSIHDCRNVKIKGLTIDYKRKPYSVATVTNIQDSSFDAVFGAAYPIDDVQAILRTSFWDAQIPHYRRPGGAEDPKCEHIGPQTMRVYMKVDPSLKGALMRTPHCFHFRPAILIQEARNTRLENVTIHSQPGMGIVAHRAENITMVGLKIVPSAGEVQSVNTDASHFTSCKGLIRFENCQFDLAGDDAISVHNYYYTIQKPAKGKGYDLVVKQADLHAAALDYPDVGDTLELVSAQTLAVVKKVVVKTRVNSIPEMRSQVTLSEDLPADLENYCLIDATRIPGVQIVGCFFGNTCPVIKARNVLIENCRMESFGVLVQNQANWHEGPGSEHVIIRNNRLRGISVNVGSPTPKVAGVHSDVLIEGNIVEVTWPDHGIYVDGTTGVTIRYNEIAGSRKPITVRYSKDVHVYGNPGVKDWSEKEVE